MVIRGNLAVIGMGISTDLNGFLSTMFSKYVISLFLGFQRNIGIRHFQINFPQ